jgi:hypothetical protein
LIGEWLATALATFLVYCGLFLVIFVAPPSK